MGSWSEIFQNQNIKNRGISGDVTEGILYRITEITDSNPLKIFLMIGTNDLAQGVTKELTFQNICKIVKTIQSQTPKAEIIVQSLFPVNPIFGNFSGHTGNTEKIIWINGNLKDWCKKNEIIFIDVFIHLKNKMDDFLNPDYSYDGLHLNGDGYKKWADAIQHLVK